MSGRREWVEWGLEEAGIAAASGQIDSLVRLAELLAEWAPRINLTSRRDSEAAIQRLILDAAALVVNLPRFESFADLGSGAGFPGLPVAVLAPDARVVLVESRLRRHHFQRAAVRELGLRSVSLLRGRIEDSEVVPCEVVVAQAVGSAARVLPMIRPWAMPGGLLTIPGGEHPPRPLGDEDPAAVGLRDVQVLTYRIPPEGRQRTLWTARVSPG